MTAPRPTSDSLSPLDRPNSYIGKTVPRPNLDRLMQGRGLYVSDMELPRMAHVVFLRSPHAHAKIIAIDAASAKQKPGVIAVVTGRELASVITPWVGILSHLKGLKSAPQHAIAVDRVCWQGEAVAAVVATSRALAEDAVDAVFVDGGVTPFNDPALQLLMLATLQGHGFCWGTGKERLLLVSVGTGRYQQTYQAKDLVGSLAALQGVTALRSLMDDCERMNRAMLQWLTDCLTPWVIDRAVGDMRLDSHNGPQLATYVRYDVILEPYWLKTELGVDLSPDKIAQIRKMDDPSNIADLVDLGKRGASSQVKPEHLPAAFDLA